MNDLEHRLRAAAEETRRLAQRRVPPRFGGHPITAPPKRRGLPAFVTAFALVGVAFGVIPWLIGGSEGAPTPVTPPVADPVVSTTWPPTTTATAPEPVCSATGTPAPDDASGLPATVAATRRAIIAAAAACDLDGLQRIAGEDFTTSFGGGGAENLRSWEEQGQGQLGKLLQLLDLSAGTVELGDGRVVYVWPAAAAYDTWEDIPDAARDEIAWLYGEGELDAMATYGAYIGWRTGIDQDGSWLYFVAGD